MRKVFLSYRRDDSRADTGRLCDHLNQHFGNDNVFMDVDDVAPGDDFIELLHSKLADCNVLIPIIGPKWAKMIDSNGQPRLGQASDYVTLEISTALKRGITLMPVLVGGASMPAVSELPNELAGLINFQALSIRHDRFHDDVLHLIRSIEHKFGNGSAVSHKSKKTKIVAFGFIAFIAMLAVVWWLMQTSEQEVLRAQPAVLTLQQVKAMVTERDFYTSRSNTAGAGGRHNYEAVVIGEDVVIVDRVTNLMWQKSASPRPMGFLELGNVVNKINRNGIAGFRDWRVPTLEETASLLSPNTTDKYHLDPVFEVAAAPAMWTIDRTPEGYCWVVWFSDGQISAEKPDHNVWLRVVRSIN